MSLAAFVGVGFFVVNSDKIALEELLFRDYLLNTPSGEQGSPQSLNQDHRKRGPIFLLLHSSEHVLNGMYF